MTIEKPQPLYNPEGQVNDPEIAREMAGEEEYLKNNPEEIIDKHKKEDPLESINSQVSKLGEMAQSKKEADYQNNLRESLADNKKYEAVILEITTKIKKTLSPEEFDMFCTMLKQHPRDVLEYFNEKKISYQN